ncbi:MAG TPA: laccase domain-containing protein, partial [Solirubrobacteraceae bacterium]|nr:laccase domain-containing protein [Solirubrobacteraceae bacterium]
GVSGPLEAVIGPGARGCCYETGPEVHAVFARYGSSDGRRLDLVAIATAQLRAAGVASIDDVGLCTLCAPAGLLFSHRRDGEGTGRQAGVAWLR